MPTMHSAALITVALASTASDNVGTRAPFMNGMTVSCPGYGRVWGSPRFSSAIEEVKRLGAKWVVIHPYARVRRDGRIESTPAEKTGYLPGAVERARRGQIQLFWKPHLAYWGSFEWRGTIDFGDNKDAWRRFFEGYERFIVDQARFAARHRLPLFSIGIEYKETLRKESEWRRIIRAVRKVYSGQLTYSANWDEVYAVPFWDALDYIGVQAYFPLSERRNPSDAELRSGWDRNVASLIALSQKHGSKPILFTEIGYPRSRNAARKPWEPEVDSSDDAIALRRRLLDLALTRVRRTPAIRGMFWWKWLPGSTFFQSDFSMKDPEAREALARAWMRPRSAVD